MHLTFKCIDPSSLSQLENPSSLSQLESHSDVTATISFRFSIINPSKRDDHLFQVFTQTIPLSGIQVRVFFRSEMEN